MLEYIILGAILIPCLPKMLLSSSGSSSAGGTTIFTIIYIVIFLAILATIIILISKGIPRLIKDCTKAYYEGKKESVNAIG